jgi:hypothetical protein
VVLALLRARIQRHRRLPGYADMHIQKNGYTYPENAIYISLFLQKTGYAPVPVPVSDTGSVEEKKEPKTKETKDPINSTLRGRRFSDDPPALANTSFTSVRSEDDLVLDSVPRYGVYIPN